MTEPMNETDLKAEFGRLRETEVQTAPAYRRPLTGSTPAAPRRRMRPAVQFALLALMLFAASAVLFDPGHDKAMPETTVLGPAPPGQGEPISALEMPTDFLLETPWFDLAATTPDFDYKFPQYELSEELSDET